MAWSLLCCLPIRLNRLTFRQLEKLADGVSDAALVIVREQMRPGDLQSEEVLLRNREKIQRSLDTAGSEGGRGEMANNGQLNLADIATGWTIGYLNFRRVAPNWCVERPALVKLAETLFQREKLCADDAACGVMGAEPEPLRRTMVSGSISR